jgi:hypothetical protein
MPSSAPGTRRPSDRNRGLELERPNLPDSRR